MAMSTRLVRLSVGMASVVPLCIGMLFIAPPAKAAVSAGLVAFAYSRGDSTATAKTRTKAKTPSADTSRVDTLGASERGPVWPMDDLKRVLDEETARAKPGANYTERKSGRVAMLCAILVPGLGQMYDEKPLKAAVAVGAESFYLGHVFLNRRYWDREKKIRDTFPSTHRNGSSTIDG